MKTDTLKKDFVESLETAYEQTDNISGGSLSVVYDTVQQFIQTQAPQAAAAMAYYAFFSLFPLLLLLSVVGSFFLESEQTLQQLLGFINETFPIAQELIKRNIEQALELRGTVGVVGLIGLLWSATGVFNILVYNINRPWPQADTRSIVNRRLVALAIVGSIVGLLILSVILTTVLNFLPRWQLPIGELAAIYETRLWSIVSNYLPALLRLLLFFSLYRWLPNTEVKWFAALGGAFAAALGWEITTAALSWYFSTGLVRYELVYGSLGSIVALLFWIYLSNLITLFGAHLSAAIARNINA